MLHSSDTLHLKMSTHFSRIDFLISPEHSMNYVTYSFQQWRKWNTEIADREEIHRLYTFFATMSLGKSLAQFKAISSLLHGTELTYKLLLTLQELRAVKDLSSVLHYGKSVLLYPKALKLNIQCGYPVYLGTKSAKGTDWDPGAGSEGEVQYPCFFVTLPLL